MTVVMATVEPEHSIRVWCVHWRDRKNPRKQNNYLNLFFCHFFFLLLQRETFTWFFTRGHSHYLTFFRPPQKNILWNMKRCRAAADTNIFINRWRGGRFYANVFFLFVSGGLRLRGEILFRLPSCYTSYEL